MIDSLTAEFEHEAQTTRKHLERLPDDRLEWRPHEKSFTAGGLGSHIVECVGYGRLGFFFGPGFGFDLARGVSAFDASTPESSYASSSQSVIGASTSSRVFEAHAGKTTITSRSLYRLAGYLAKA